MPTFAAVDLGASSGRVIAAQIDDERIELDEVHRFPNEPVRRQTGLHWDVPRLFREVLTGLRAANAQHDVRSIGIDTWAIDYGLLDTSGALLGDPFHYRDSRTSTPPTRPLPPAERRYAINGLQHLPFDTLHQLAVEAPERLAAADHLALIPDLLTELLTGQCVAEMTNASTTGLLDATTRAWSPELGAAVGVPPGLLGPLVAPGTAIGALRSEHVAATGIGGAVPVTTVGSHDTASAVVGVPAITERFAYIACGTWGLVGVELDQPVLTEASRRANFTNELGVDGRVRYLRNVSGLWLLQESIRTWTAEGGPNDLAALLDAARGLPAGPVIDVNDPDLVPPDDMPRRIAAACERAGHRAPATPAETVRCIVDSLAQGFAQTVADAAALTSRRIDVVHVVGGGARNELLCQLTADACGRPVIAGPVEATAIGNALVQARAAGVLHGSLESLRRLVAATQELRRYDPRSR